MDKEDLRKYLKINNMTASDLSEKIGVPVRTVQGWCSGRPVPSWLDVFLRKLDFSESLSSRINFLEKFTCNIRSKLNSLREEFNLPCTSYETKVNLKSQMSVLICLWVELYPQDNNYFFNHVFSEFQEIRDSCQWHI